MGWPAMGFTHCMLHWPCSMRQQVSPALQHETPQHELLPHVDASMSQGTALHPPSQKGVAPLQVMPQPLQLCGSLYMLTHVPLQHVSPPLPHGGLQAPPPEPPEVLLPELDAPELEPPELEAPELAPPELVPLDEPEASPPELPAPEDAAFSSPLWSTDASVLVPVVDPPQSTPASAAAPMIVAIDPPQPVSAMPTRNILPFTTGLPSHGG
jgi:hypothetical protein